MSDSRPHDDKVIDTLIRCAFVMTMDDQRDALLKDQSIAITAGRIQAIVPRDEDDQFTATEIIELPQHVVLPGYVNAHGHAAMSLFRGLADDLPLMTWLEQHIWPAEAQWVTPEFVYQGTQLAMAEMLKCGTTTFADMYFYSHDSMSAAADVGMRAVGFTPVLDFPTNYAQNSDEYIRKALATHDYFKQHDCIHVGIGPHAPYTVSDEPLLEIKTLADQIDCPVQIHLHETAFEVQQSLETYNVRPTQRLADLGFLNERVSCVHMTQIMDSDISLLQQSGASVVHCPESNLKLASGFCPVNQLLDANITVAIGTDGAASNNDLNIQGELKTAAILAKAVAQDAAAVNAYSALKCATINGAKALGIDDITGSIAVGKYADIQAIKLSALEQQPLYNIPSQLVYTDSSRYTDHVWVAGKRKLKDGELVVLNESELAGIAIQWRDKIKS